MMVYQKKFRISDMKYFLLIKKAILAGVSRSVKKRQCFLALCLFPFYANGESSPPDTYSYSLSISPVTTVPETTVTDYYQGTDTVESGIKVTARLSPSPSVSNEKSSSIILHSAISSKTARIETSNGNYTVDVFSTGSNGAMEMSVTPDGFPYPTNSLTVKPLNKTLTSFSIKDAISQTTKVVNFPSTKIPIRTKRLADKLSCNDSTVLKKVDARKLYLNKKEELLHNRENWLKKTEDELDERNSMLIALGAVEAVIAAGIFVFLAIKYNLLGNILSVCRSGGEAAPSETIPLAVMNAAP